jgi:hypothetical protein
MGLRVYWNTVRNNGIQKICPGLIISVSLALEFLFTRAKIQQQFNYNPIIIVG